MAGVPIYEYGCDGCGTVFEQLRPMTSSDTAECPSCGIAGARRLVSRVASFGRGDCGPGAFT